VLPARVHVQFRGTPAFFNAWYITTLFSASAIGIVAGMDPTVPAEFRWDADVGRQDPGPLSPKDSPDRRRPRSPGRQLTRSTASIGSYFRSSKFVAVAIGQVSTRGKTNRFRSDGIDSPFRSPAPYYADRTLCVQQRARRGQRLRLAGTARDPILQHDAGDAGGVQPGRDLFPFQSHARFQ